MGILSFSQLLGVRGFSSAYTVIRQIFHLSRQERFNNLSRSAAAVNGGSRKTWHYYFHLSVQK